MEIVVVGIDGSGKTRLTEHLVAGLEARNITTARIHVPDFPSLPWWCRGIGKSIVACWHFADSRGSRFLIMPLMACAVFLFFAARREVKKASVVFIEHHPRIDLPVFARLYGGRFGGFLGRAIAPLWRAPDMVIMLEVPVEIAFERIVKRGQPLQLHEMPETLMRLAELLRASARHVDPQCLFLTEPDPEAIINIAYGFLSQRRRDCCND